MFDTLQEAGEDTAVEVDRVVIVEPGRGELELGVEQPERLVLM